MVNHLILLSAWFSITLWVGFEEDLRAMEKEIITFVWSGQNQPKKHRVNKATLYRPRRDGSHLNCTANESSDWEVDSVDFIAWDTAPEEDLVPQD